MTTLYRPVPIETTEQAEALPVGTLAVNWEIPSAAVRVAPDDADGWPWLVNAQSLGWHSHIVGHTALVPIRATAITQQAELCKPGVTVQYVTDKIQEDQ